MADNRLQYIFDLINGKDTVTPALTTIGKGVKGISKGYSALSKTIKNVGGAVFNLKTGFLLLAGAFSFSKAIDAANQQEDAINQLNIALKITGKLTDETSKDIQEFASSLQNASKFGDEVILKNAALIQSLGDLDKEGLKKATQAAADMSAALGIDLTAAATLVGKAAVGEIGSFSRYGVVIKKGADNAETFANTLDILNSKFGGAAAGQIETFSGATTQLGNTFGDLVEEVGFFITKNDAVIEAVALLHDGFKELITVVQENQGAIFDLATKSIKLLVGAFGGIIKGISGVSTGFLNLKADFENTFGENRVSKLRTLNSEFRNLKKELDDTSGKGLDQTETLKQMNDVKRQIELIRKARKKSNKERRASLDFFKDFEKTIDQITDKIAGVENKDVKVKVSASQGKNQEIANKILLDKKKVEEEIATAKAAFEKLDGLLVNAGKSQKEILTETHNGRLQIIKDALVKGKVSEEDVFDLRKRANADFQSKLSKVTLKETAERNKLIVEAEKKHQEELKKQRDFSRLAARDPIKALTSTDDPLTSKQKVEIGFGVSTDILKGAAGAKKLLVDGAAQFLGPLGDAAKPLLDAFSQGPEATKQMVKDFISALPILVKNLILAVPAFVEAFIEEIPRMVESLVEETPKIISKLISQIPRLVSAIISQTPQIVSAMAKGVFVALGELGSFITEKLKDLPQQLIDAMIRAAKEFLKELKKGATSVFGKVGDVFGKVGSALGKIGSVFGFHEGGKIPAGFNNDNFPMTATSGEYVIDKSLTSRLENFLGKQGQASPSNDTGSNSALTNSLLSSILSALLNNQTISTSVEFNQDTLAEIMVNLNRTGTRTA